jgi:hypothetical protein
VTRGCRLRFFGYDLTGGREVKLRERPLTKSEWEERERLKMKRSKKREKNRKRLERRREEREKGVSNAS